VAAGYKRPKKGEQRKIPDEDLTPGQRQQRQFVLNQADFTGFLASDPVLVEPEKGSDRFKPHIRITLSKTRGIFNVLVPVRIYGEEKMDEFRAMRVRKGDFCKVRGGMANHGLTTKAGTKLRVLHLNAFEFSLIHRSHSSPERDDRPPPESPTARPNPLGSGS
jgi:hypothetical protein